MQYFDSKTTTGRNEQPPPGGASPSFFFPPDTRTFTHAMNVNPTEPPRPSLATENTQEGDEAYEEFEENQQKLTVHTLLRQTGLGIKIRFLLALTLIAVFPAISLVLLLGDPFGQEQRATVGQALMLQAQAQGSAIDQAITTRQAAVSHLAQKALLFQAAVAGIDANEQVTPLLQTAQQIDPSSLAWMLVQSNGTIVSTGDPAHRLVGLKLSHAIIVSDPARLMHLVQAVSGRSAHSAFLLSNDTHIHGGWLAIAFPVQQNNRASGAALLAVFSLQKVTQGFITTTGGMTGMTAVLLDQQGQIVVGAGTTGQQAFAMAPPSVQALPLGTAAPTILSDDPLTGRTDMAVGVPVKALGGRYVLLVPQDSVLTNSLGREFFAGRNTPLLILAILVIVVLVATWVALPIVRPIRRATRQVGITTEEVRLLANNARRIAQEHATGTTILRGASKRLSGRRQSIIRDGMNITQICSALWPRIQWLRQLTQGSTNKQLVETLQILQQGLYQINGLGTAIAGGLENDTTLNQLDGAMESAREISVQFEDAGLQLERGAEELEVAARTLL